MRQFYFILISCVSFVFIGNAQIFEPEGLNMPGDWDGTFRNPDVVDPTFQSFAQFSPNGELTKISAGTLRWQTTFAAAASGAEAIGGSRFFKFTSGPDTNYYANQWTRSTVTFDAIETYTQCNSCNPPATAITLTNGSFYTMNFEDSGYTTTRAIFMETTGAPVGFDISSSTVQTPPNNITDGTPVTVFGTLAATPNTELRIFIRYSTDGFATSDVVEMTNSIPGFPEEVDGIIPGIVNTAGTTVDYYLFTTTVDATTIIDESEYDLISIDIENNNGSNYSYTVRDIQTTAASGNWNTPATWTSGSVPNTNDVVELNHFVTVASDISHSGNITINSPNVLVISAGQSLTHTGLNFVNNGGVLINSTSTSFGSLIISPSTTISGSGEVDYFRFVNSNANGNDLIAPPLGGQSWSDFLSSGANATRLFDDGNTSPTTYAFAPFVKANGDYENFTDVTSATLTSGVGYRAATDSGADLAFTGTVETATITNDIQNSGPGFQEWNLVGNPYSSYINVQDFLNTEVAPGVSNLDLFNSGAAAIYGYDGDASNGWTVWNLATTNATDLIAPGQGFFVSADATNAGLYDLTFTPDIRSTGSSDDFIPGRNAALVNLELQLSSSTADYVTDFYFNSNASLGLDPGYDAAIFGNSAPAFSIYSELVQDNTGEPIAVQALGANDFENTTIALGVNANQGEPITFGISANTLPAGTKVFLDDTVANTSTELTVGDYGLTPSTPLSGTGRFFIRFEGSALNTTDVALDGLAIFVENKEIIVAGQLNIATTMRLYDLQGRLVKTTALNLNEVQQRMDASALTSGIYIVELSDGTSTKTQKVILR
ncbi:T9SS type A sorting domain-containing protein [Winogradskyella sp. DF17]|uniref:T9SS type A sorting domain-containing protein n=1 Tax=Winogradskyella pelagia TaxID=2819984 RepID=A0ABS3T0H9_9FLAO|nr:T9SS type A sorting domain-containing protein [Winogradskyella sp. DF17]MBO3115764.1 T9SS type A sorting domain-containing protein [Winogradskyella sp. DF17]